MKTRVAVFFGGRSPEHDISVITGLQALEALDGDRFSSFPVYVAPDGKWFLGDALRSRTTYIPRENTLKTLEGVTLDLWPNVEGRGRLLPVKPGGLFFSRLASSIGMEGQAKCIEGRRYWLPDGSERYLVDAALLNQHTERLRAALAGGADRTARCG